MNLVNAMISNFCWILKSENILETKKTFKWFIKFESNV